MPSVRYYNQTAPFWDFVANLEEQGRQHPFFAGNNRDQGGEESDNEQQQRPNPWTEGWAGFPFGPFPYRGRHHGPGRHHHGPPPPPEDDQPARGPPPPEYEERSGEESATEKERDPQEGPSESRAGRGGPHGRRGGHRHGSPGPHRGPGIHRERSFGRCGGRGRGGFGGRGGHRGGPFGHHPPSFGPMGGFGPLAEMFQNQLFGDSNNATNDKSEDFKPEVDVFDTAEGFVVHVSLPGAKKEDVGVNWDAEKSELAIAGVVYRPADEETLKSLALDERKVGAFERKVRLGSRANPAQVDVESISAKLEDGILRVEVPKLDSGYVEIKKVDIE